MLIGLGAEVCPEDENYRIVKTLRGSSAYSQRTSKNQKSISNVDLGSGSLLHAIGFRKPEYYTTFFGWARVAGICAQIMDERNARDGRGTPIYRPKYIPVNQPHRRLE